MAAEGEKAAEDSQKMGAAVGEKGPATANKEMGKMGATEKRVAPADKKGAMAEKEEVATKEEKGEGEEEEEEKRSTAKDKGEFGSTSAKRAEKKKAEAEEKEATFTWFSGISLSEKRTAAAEGGKRHRRRFKRTMGQRLEEKGALAEASEEVAGEKEIFFFRARGKIITLKSWDGMLFEVTEAAAQMSVLLSDMIDKGCAGSNILLPSIDARTLVTVIEYCNKHGAAAATAKPNANHGADEGSSSGNVEASVEALRAWDRKLIDGLTQDALYDVITAAIFLQIEGLVDAACQKADNADMVEGKTPEQMGQIEKEEMFTWFSGIAFCQKETAAEEGERRERRRFRRTKGQWPDKKGAMEEVKEEVVGKKETFVFGASRRKIITLKSSDGMLFTLSEEAARLSVLLADMIGLGSAGSNIPVSNIDARTLATMIKYCNKHADASANHRVDEGSSSNSSFGASRETLKEWDRKLVDGLSQDALYDIIKAANFLDVKGLLEAACQKVADMVKGKTAEQMRKMFGIDNDFTEEEEEEEICKENPWAFEE